jgi:hypothetical protein
MNYEKHVTPANLLSNYLEGKIKAEYISSFLPKFASGFDLVEHVQHHQIFTSVSTDMSQSLTGHLRPW